MSGQGFRTKEQIADRAFDRFVVSTASKRDGWTTGEKPEPVDELPATAKPAPTWVWGAVFTIAAVLIVLLVQLEAFK